MTSVNKRKKTAYFVSLVIISIFTISMELAFRAYLYTEYGSGSTIAGSIPNFVSVIFFGLVFKVGYGERHDASPTKMSLMGAGSMIIYEFIQPLIQGRTFDWLDVSASIIGGLSVFILLFTIDRYLTNEKIP